MQFAHPWQYGMPEWRVQVACFWANFRLRMLLNKVLPSVFHKPAYKLHKEGALTYTEILQRVTSTTRRIVGLGASLVVVLAAVGVAVAVRL